MKHAGDSLFLVSSERSPFSDRAVLLRGVKRKKERFGFRTSIGEEEVGSFSDVKICIAVNRKRLSASAARPSQRDYVAAFCLRRPLIAWLIFNVRQTRAIFGRNHQPEEKPSARREPERHRKEDFGTVSLKNIPSA
jgi:hypothetical protein